MANKPRGASKGKKTEWNPSPEDYAEIELELRRRKEKHEALMKGFQRDPMGYCRYYFRDEIYSPDIKKMAQSVVENPMTGVCSANSTGKSHMFARLAKWFIDAYSPSGTTKVFIAAAPPEANLKTVWGGIQTLQIKYPHLFPSKVMDNWYYVNPDPFGDPLARGEWYVRGVPIPDNASPEKRKESFTGKHAEHLLFILDEANSIDEPIWEAIDECLRGAVVGRVLFAFNPRLRSGAAWERWSKGRCKAIQISAFTHPNVRTGVNHIPGAVNRQDVVSKTVAWTRKMNPDEKIDEENCFELPDFLVGERAVLDDGSLSEPLEAGWREITVGNYSYSILGRPPKVSATALIQPDWIAAARIRYDQWVAEHGDNPPEGVSPVQAMDVATESTNADANPHCSRWGGFVKFRVWKGLEQTETERNAADLFREEKARILFVDGTGVGAGTAAHLQDKGVSAVKVMLESVPTGLAIETHNGQRMEGHFDRLYDQLLWAVREWLNPANGMEAMLPPIDRLTDALTKLTYRRHTRTQKIQVGRIVRERDEHGNRTDKTTLKMTLGYSPDELWALALTFSPDGGGWVQAHWRE